MRACIRYCELQKFFFTFFVFFYSSFRSRVKMTVTIVSYVPKMQIKLASHYLAPLFRNIWTSSELGRAAADSPVSATNNPETPTRAFDLWPYLWPYSDL